MTDAIQVEKQSVANVQDDIVLRVEKVTKVFPGTVALDEVDFNVYRGMVNVLVGENGAGKSTLMKILAGVESPTSGHLVLEGKEIKIRSPHEAEHQGIGIIYQELNLCPNMNVAENIFLAREVTLRGVVVDKKAQIEAARELIQRMEHNIDPTVLVGELRLGQQQIIEIAKALSQNVKILIMDEPTSALSTSEVEVLFKLIRDLKERGVSIIYISHKLEELLQIGDYITVLRDGRRIAQENASKVDLPWIIENMVGRKPAALFSHMEHEIGEPVLEANDICLPRIGGGFTVDHVSLNLHRGEILGLYGLMGAGRSELLECLAGIRPESTGKVILAGKDLSATLIKERIQEGLVLIPEDRQRDGIIQTLSVAHNMLLASLRKYISSFVLSTSKEKTATERMVKDLSIRVASAQQLITSLSGGNQQKVVVAKGLLTAPKVLMMDEPTRGIDVGAKSEIFEIMSRLAAQGLGILFISSELKEILAMSDRILVLSKGSITGEFSRAQATEEALVAASGIGHGVGKNGINNGGVNGTAR